MKNIPEFSFGFGYKLISSPWLTDWYELIKIKRTFKERFFTKPWMPKIKHKYIEGPQEPKKEVIIINGKIVGHPETLRIISAMLEARNR